MPLTLREIRENTAKARELMSRAREEKFAVGAFNLDNQETLKAVCRAAVAKKSPVLVELNHREALSLGIENVRDMVDNYKRELDIEIYLNLDHSPTVEDAVAGIEAGFEFIQLDISSSDRGVTEEEIITKTKLVVDYARLTGALVESEPQYFNQTAGKGVKVNYEDIKKTFSTPEAAKHFVDATGIDTFAASVGNLHFDYQAPKTLDLELLRHIRRSIDCNISLHGGNGIPAHYFKDAVEIGVNKINVSSEMRMAFRNKLEAILKNNPDELALSSLMDEVISAVQQIAEEKIDLFNSSGRAEV